MNNDINELRTHLFDTLKGLKDKTIDVDTARAVSLIADNIIDTAKVEVDFLRVAGGGGTGFIAQDGEAPRISNTPTGTKRVEGNRTIHTLKS